MTDKLQQALQDIELLATKAQDIIAQMIEREVEWWKENHEHSDDDLINPKEKAKKDSIDRL